MSGMKALKKGRDRTPLFPILKARRQALIGTNPKRAVLLRTNQDEFCRKQLMAATRLKVFSLEYIIFPIFGD